MIWRPFLLCGMCESDQTKFGRKGSCYQSPDMPVWCACGALLQMMVQFLFEALSHGLEECLWVRTLSRAWKISFGRQQTSHATVANHVVQASWSFQRSRSPLRAPVRKVLSQLAADCVNAAGSANARPRCQHWCDEQCQTRMLCSLVACQSLAGWGSLWPKGPDFHLVEPLDHGQEP